MKASAIRIDIQEVQTLERAEPAVAIATATVKFQLSGNLSFLQDASISMHAKEDKMKKLLLQALRDLDLR